METNGQAVQNLYGIINSIRQPGCFGLLISQVKREDIYGSPRISATPPDLSPRNGTICIRLTLKPKLLCTYPKGKVYEAENGADMLREPHRHW